MSGRRNACRPHCCLVRRPLLRLAGLPVYRDTEVWDYFGSFFTVQRPLPAKQKSGRSPLEKSSLNDAGDVAGGDDQVVRRVWV